MSDSGTQEPRTRRVGPHLYLPGMYLTHDPQVTDRPDLGLVIIYAFRDQVTQFQVTDSATARAHAAAWDRAAGYLEAQERDRGADQDGEAS